jgi:hypothetical protein
MAKSGRFRTPFKKSGTPDASLDTALDRHVTARTCHQHALHRPATPSLVHERPAAPLFLKGVLRTALGVGLASLVLASGTAAVAGAGVAQAGQFHVYACRTPSGASAPADGWSGSKVGAATFVGDTCPQGGALVAALYEEPNRTANTATATWAFSAPPNTSIAGATLWRAGDADGGSAIGATYQFWFAGPENLDTPTNAFGQCMGGSECLVGVGNTSQPLSNENRLGVPTANLGTHLYLDASCVGELGYKCNEGQHDAHYYTAVVYLYAADITLEQGEGPSANNLGGELATAPSVRGASDVTFSASDPGAGVYEATITIDGRVVQTTPLDENGGRCKDVGENGELAFFYVQPCEQALSADVALDTTKLANGSHHLLVSVLDAAGNSAPVLDRTITVANPAPPSPPGPANGTNASSQATLAASWEGTSRQHIACAYGREPAISGRLTGPGGTPIGNAQIDLTETPAYTGAKPVALVGPHTAANGTFTVRPPHSISSDQLTFGYRAHLDTEPPAATRTLALTVRAGIALQISPRTASVGRSIRFTGLLHGAPVPSHGKQLVLEANSPGSGWIEFDVIHTTAKGRFHASYRFKLPGPVAYRFRVVSNEEADFPFATGRSNTVGVYERG